jgi:hypothetical protein
MAVPPTTVIKVPIDKADPIQITLSNSASDIDETSCPNHPLTHFGASSAKAGCAIVNVRNISMLVKLVELIEIIEVIGSFI